MDDAQIVTDLWAILAPSPPDLIKGATREIGKKIPGAAMTISSNSATGR
jgi:hypothetical protein